MPSQKLIVLGLFEGDSFPTPKTHNEQIYVKARLDDVWLETEAVKADSNPDLNTELVWDMNKTQLKALRTKKAPIKVEVWQAEEKLGYLVLDLRNALPVRDDQQPVIIKMKLLGSKHKPIPSLQVSLSMEDVPGDEEEDSSVTESLPVSTKGSFSLTSKGSVVASRHNDVSSVLTPVLDEEKGYFRIGPETKNQQKFSLGVCIVFARHLDLLLPSDLAVNSDDEYYFQYDLLGSDISTEPFKGLAEPDFKAEKATALIKSTAGSMEQFFRERGSLSVKVVKDSCILGEAHINLSDVMPVRADNILDKPVSYEGRIPVVSAHNFRIAKDDNGDFPQIGIEVVFRKEDAIITPDASKDVTGMDVETTQDNLDITEGQLSLSEVQQSSISFSDDTKLPEKEDTVVDITDSPSKLPVHPPPVGANPPGLSPPVRLGVSPREKHGRNVSVELFPEDRQTDDTIYLSPPKQPRLTPQPDSNPKQQPRLTPQPDESRSQTLPVVKPQMYAPDVSSESTDSTTRFSLLKPKQNKPEAFSTYKWTVDLKTIVMNRSFNDLTLTYKYKPFSRNSISTSPGFPVVQGKPTAIPRGFCEFNFSVPESKLKSTLAKHFLEINVEEDEVVTVGLATINQVAVFSKEVGRSGRVYDGVADILHMGAVVGKIQYQLVMDTPGLEKEVKVVDKVDKMEVGKVEGSVVDPEVRARMTAEAARELELWKMDQMNEFNEVKKKYHENLVEERRQHLSTLGEEWKEREMAREIELEQKKEAIEGLEKELKQALENIEVEKVELRKEKAELEEAKKNLKDEKGQALEKLKAKLRTSEGEIGKQTVELEILAKKTCYLEEEVERLEKEKASTRTKEVETLSQLTKLRAERTTWQASLEQSEKAKEFYKKSWHAVKTELDELRSEKEKMQSDKIERLESELNDMKKKAASHDLLQSELSHLRRQYAASRLDSKQLTSEIADSVFEENSSHDAIPVKQRSVDTEVLGSKDSSKAIGINGRQVSGPGKLSGGSSVEESLRLKERGASVGEDVIKLKQRNREDIARLRKTMSVQCEGSNNRKKITKQLSVGGAVDLKKSDFLEDEINLIRPDTRKENIGLTRVSPCSSTGEGGMTVLQNNTNSEMTTSIPQTVRKSKPCWGGGVAMPVLGGGVTMPVQTPKTQLQKLIEEKNMLLRTGVYSEDDHLVSRLTREIIKLQQP